MKILISNKKNSVAGFTIIELMIASTIFSVLLLIMTFAIIQISRVYYRGITSAQTQEIARTVLDEISRSIQFQGGTITGTPAVPSLGPNKFCVGDKRYSYILGRQLMDSPTFPQSKNVLVVDDKMPGCASVSAQNIDSVNLNSNSRELLAANMRLASLQVNDKGNGLWEVAVRVVYGDNDLLEDSIGADGILDTCRSIQFGAQFCAASELRTVVKKRVQ